MMGKSGSTIETQGAPGQPGADLTVEQVIDYLIRHPDFFAQHPELFDLMRPPARDLGKGVVDFQAQLVERQRTRMEALRHDLTEVIETSRANLDQQHRVFTAVLQLLECQTFETLIETITGELAPLLGVDAIGLAVESMPGREVSMAVALRTGVHVVPEGTVAARLRGADTALRSDIEGDAVLFGPAAQFVRSEALLRLNWSVLAPPGLLAFGSADPNGFEPNQGTEQITFLARVVERIIAAWLDLPHE
jgi:uncharacterized protein